MLKNLQYFYLFVFLSSLSGFAQTQSTITTQPLAVASICPGSLLDVPCTWTGTYSGNNVFTVQLSNGSEYVNVTTGNLNFSNTTGRYFVTATIPANTAAGTTYRVRVTASNPAVIGSPSNTQFAVKIKPGMPTVTPLDVMCQGTTATQLVF